MVIENDSQEMLRRLRQLEEENERLRKASKPEVGIRLTVVESEFKGHPTLTFHGPFRPFSLGLTKVRVLKEMWGEVESFLLRHSRGKYDKNFSDDDKI